MKNRPIGHLLKLLLISFLVMPILLSSCQDAPKNVPTKLETQVKAASSDHGGAKVILLGVDGADMWAINRLIEKGYLPNFKRMMETGAYGILKTDVAYSPTTWTTIATGVNIKKHGIVPDDGGAFFNSIADVKYPRLWEVAEKYGVTNHVSDYYFYEKAEDPTINRKSAEIHPLVQRTCLSFGFDFKMPFGEKAHQCLFDMNNQLSNLAQQRKELDSEKVDLFISYFREVDTISHYYFGMFKKFETGAQIPEELKASFEKAAQVVSDVYQVIDELVGDIRRAYPEATIILVSDHGFELDHDIGVMLLLYPELLQALGVENPKGGENERLKIAGLDSYMIVESDNHQVEYDSWLLGIGFKKFVFEGPDAETAAERAWKLLGSFKIDDLPFFQRQDDFTIEVNEEIKKRPLEFPPIGGHYIFFNPNSGHHCKEQDGVIFIDGPGVKPAWEIMDAAVTDIAPTIYALLGIPLARTLDGRPIKKAFTPKALPGLKKPKVATYGPAPHYNPNAIRSDIPPEKIIELKSLGYL